MNGTKYGFAKGLWRNSAGAAADPTTRKVHDSFMSFKKKHDAWKGLSEAGFMKAVNG